MEGTGWEAGLGWPASPSYGPYEAIGARIWCANVLVAESGWQGNFHYGLVRARHTKWATFWIKNSGISVPWSNRAGLPPTGESRCQLANRAANWTTPWRPPGADGHQQGTARRAVRAGVKYSSQGPNGRGAGKRRANGVNAANGRRDVSTYLHEQA